MTNVVHLEPWLTKKELATHLGCGVRFIEARIARHLPDPMPHAMIAGRVKFKVSLVEPWLEEHGDFERRAS